MKIVISDHRHEDRRANALRDITGATIEPPQPTYDPVPRIENYDWRETVDNREVVIDLEPEDFTGELAVPEVLQGKPSGKHQGEFFVRRIIICYSRTYDSNGSDALDNWSRYGRILVKGPNRRADGSEGAKDNSFIYPKVREVESDELWTQEEVESTGYRYRDGSIPEWRLKMVGTPKWVKVADPLPDWLAAIADRVHPRTGLPFAYPDEHRFGEFAPQPELQPLVTA